MYHDKNKVFQHYTINITLPIVNNSNTPIQADEESYIFFTHLEPWVSDLQFLCSLMKSLHLVQHYEDQALKEQSVLNIHIRHDMMQKHAVKHWQFTITCQCMAQGRSADSLLSLGGINAMSYLLSPASTNISMYILRC